MPDSFEIPWTVAHQSPLSIGFPRQEYWREFPFPSLGGSSQLRDQTYISGFASEFFTAEPPGKPPLEGN